MCLLVFQYDQHPIYSLVFAGNRDEFYGRPTAPASFWDDAPHVLAGQDLKAGGTWMGVTRNGHWGVVTNIRDQHPRKEDAPSRGTLVADYLRDEPAPKPYFDHIAAEADRYNGFNLLLGTPTSLYYLTNREATVQALESGLYGLSNDRLNTPWPKVQRAKAALEDRLKADQVSPETLLDLLDDRRPAPDDRLPETGFGQERERMLSSIFIDGADYGTRASTVLLIDRAGTVTFVERSFEDGTAEETRRYSFGVTAPSRTHQ